LSIFINKNNYCK